MKQITKKAYEKVHLTRTGRREIIRMLLRTQVLDVEAVNEASLEMFGAPLEAPKPVARGKRPLYHFVYVFRANGLCKIGRSVDPDWRLKQLQTALAYPIEIVHTIRTLEHGLERALHGRFKDQRERGEWYALTEADIDWIKAFGMTAAA